ncbi:hypothetical protein [Micromonospora andamanensis]|nr:hypothetical protein [Micromonospora andamanensis]
MPEDVAGSRRGLAAEFGSVPDGDVRPAVPRSTAPLAGHVAVLRS